MTPFASVLILALAAGLGAGDAVAQEGVTQEPEALVLTLEEVLGIAEASNPTYRRSVNDLGLNPVETRATWAKELVPSARLSLFNTSYTGNIQRIGVDDFGNPIEKPDAEWFFSSSTSQSLNLNWTVQGSSLFDAFRSQKVTNRQRHLSEDAALLDLRARVRRQYFEVLEQSALLGVEEEVAASRRTDLDLARELFRLARSSRVDVLTAELEIEQQALTVAQQVSAREEAKLALRSLIGDPALPPFTLAAEEVPVFDPATLDAEVLVARALSVHPEVRQASSEVEGASVGVSEARNAWWPTLSVNYNLFQRARADEARALFDPPLERDFEQSFDVSVAFPFFNDYFGNRQKIEQAEVDLANRREQLRETALQTEEAVRSALLGLRNQHTSLRLAERSLAIAAEALELARQEYRIGTRSFDQLQDVVENEAEARRQVITTRFGFADALLDLEEAVGGTVREAGRSGGEDAPSGGDAAGASGR